MLKNSLFLMMKMNQVQLCIPHCAPPVFMFQTSYNNNNNRSKEALYRLIHE